MHDMKNSELQQENTASKKALKKILAQEISMRPRLYFTAKVVALFVVALLTLAVSISLGSFILFSIRASNETSLLGFGIPGYAIFLQVFPWRLFILDIICVVLLEWLLRKFRFGYKSPLLYLFFMILVIMLSATLVIDHSRMSDRVLQGARDNGIPLIGSLYDQGRRSPSVESGVCPCVVEGINGNTLMMKETMSDGIQQQVTVIMPSDQATSSIHVGDHLFIVGNFTHGILRAFGLPTPLGDLN